MSLISSSPDVILSVAHWLSVTEAEGPGRRFALWFQGCPLRCPGCCNPEMLPFAGGMPMPLAEATALIAKAKSQHAIEGITLLGGEPFAHAQGAIRLAEAAHRLGLSVMAFSGYTLEEIQTLPTPDADRLLSQIDILVDGPYRRDLPETRRRWIGSSNQRIHFLTDRCQADDPRWLLGNTLEIRWHDGELQVNGFPARGAVGIWKRPRQARSASE